MSLLVALTMAATNNSMTVRQRVYLTPVNFMTPRLEPKHLAYAEPQLNRQQASRREYQLKQLSKHNKEQLVYSYSLSSKTKK